MSLVSLTERERERERERIKNYKTANKEITSQTDLYLVSLSSETYDFEDKITKY